MKREYRNEIDKDTGEACEFSEDEKVVSACSGSNAKEDDVKTQDIIRWVLTIVLLVFMWRDGHTMTSIIVTILTVGTELNGLVLRGVVDSLQAQNGGEDVCEK